MNPPTYPCAVALFCRAPIPAHAKTRLACELGAAGAARVHETLGEFAVRTAVASSIGPVTVWCAPDQRHAFFTKLVRNLPIRLARQRGDDLGLRMLHAAHTTLRSAHSVLLIGSDCPVLTTGYLREAARCLQQVDAVLGPAEDGGYVLLGLKRARRELFARMPWGAQEVLAETRTRLQALDWRWRELATLWDIDTPADLARWRRELTPGRSRGSVSAD